MSFTHNTNTGSVFHNKEKKSEKHSDFSGSININGQIFWLNGWTKDGQKGKYISLSAKPQEPKTLEAQPSSSSQEEFKESIDKLPF